MHGQAFGISAEGQFDIRETPIFDRESPVQEGDAGLAISGCLQGLAGHYPLFWSRGRDLESERLGHLQVCRCPLRLRANRELRLTECWGPVRPDGSEIGVGRNFDARWKDHRKLRVDT